MLLKEFFDLNPYKRFLNIYINRFVLPPLNFVEKNDPEPGKFTTVHNNLVFPRPPEHIGTWEIFGK